MTLSKFKKSIIKVARVYQLYLMLLVPVVLVVVFCYFPMYGAQIALKNGLVWKKVSG